MLQYVLILLITVYVFSILKSLISLLKIKNILKTIAKYLNSASLGAEFPAYIHKKDGYNECLENLLLSYPTISRYTGIYSKSLQYGDSDFNTYKKAYSLYTELLMKRNYLLDDFFPIIKSGFINKNYVSYSVFAF